MANVCKRDGVMSHKGSRHLANVLMSAISGHDQGTWITLLLHARRILKVTSPTDMRRQAIHATETNKQGPVPHPFKVHLLDESADLQGRHWMMQSRSRHADREHALWPVRHTRKTATTRRIGRIHYGARDVTVRRALLSAR